MSPLYKFSVVLGLMSLCCPGWAQQVNQKDTKTELRELGFSDKRLSSIQLAKASYNCSGQQITIKIVDGNRVQLTTTGVMASAQPGASNSKICQVALKVRAPSGTAISIASSHMVAKGQTSSSDLATSQNRLLERLFFSFDRQPNLNSPSNANGTYSFPARTVNGVFNGLLDTYQTASAANAPRSQCSVGNSQIVYLDLILKVTSGVAGPAATMSLSDGATPLVQEFLLGLSNCSVQPAPQPIPQPTPYPDPQPYPTPSPAPMCTRGDFCSGGHVVDWSCNCGYEYGGVDQGNGCYHIPTQQTCGYQPPAPAPAPRCTTGDFCSSGRVVDWSCNCGYVSGGVDQGNGCYHVPTSQSCGFQPQPEPTPAPAPTPAPSCSTGSFCNGSETIDWSCGCGYVSGGVDQGNGCYHVPTGRSCH